MAKLNKIKTNCKCTCISNSADLLLIPFGQTYSFMEAFWSENIPTKIVTAHPRTHLSPWEYFIP